MHHVSKGVAVGLVHNCESSSGNTALRSGSLSKSWRWYKNELQNNIVKIKATEFFMDRSLVKFFRRTL